MSSPHQLTANDVRRLAQLQLLVLPDSAISRLGQRYVRSFYRYAQRSPLELVLVEREENGDIIAGCVVTTDIASLERRLFLHTSLLVEAAIKPAWLLSVLRGRGGTPQCGAESVSYTHLTLPTTPYV